jgi:hypothetical protein
MNTHPLEICHDYGTFEDFMTLDKLNKMRGTRSTIFLAVVVVLGLAMVGCASSPDPRLAAFQQREKTFGRPDWIVLPTEQGGEEWVAPSAVENEVRGRNRNDPPELRLDYSPNQRQVWLYPGEGTQVRFEPNSEPRRTPMEPHFIRRHKEAQAAGERAKVDAQRAVQDLQRQLSEQRREGTREADGD